MPDSRFEPATAFSDLEIDRIQSTLGRNLPKDYCDFVKEYGGAFVGGSIDGSPELPILAFFCADERSGVMSKLSAYPDLRDEGILPFADCELGNLYVMDRNNIIHYLNYYGTRTTARMVSESFLDFISRIVVTDE